MAGTGNWRQISPTINAVRKARKTFTWAYVNHGVVKVASPYWGFGKLICTMKGLPPIPIEVLNETEVATPGKVIVKTNDGFQVSEFVMGMLGNDIATHAAILSQDLALFPAFRFGQAISDFGQILTVSYGDDGTTIQGETLVCHASARFLQAPGNQEGDNDGEIQFYSDYNQIYQSKGATHFNIEGWYNSGAVVNAAAPDGALDVYVLGTANNSSSAYVASSALVMDSAGGTHGKYVPLLMAYNATTAAWGVLQDTTDFTFTLATGTITITAGSAYENLPAGSKLIAIWQSTQANATTHGNSTGMKDAWEAWRQYQGLGV